jgi:hypothetical protein
VLGVQSHEDARREKIVAVHWQRTRGRDREISRTREFAGNAQVVGVKVAGARTRGGEGARGFVAVHLRRTGGRDQEISRTREFAGLKPKYWVSKVARREDARRRSEREDQ